MKTKRRVGFTTSFPVEVVFAAGHIPIDLNNIFLTGDSAKHIHHAELKGFPRTICSWIKGNYAAALAANLDEVIGIVQGDCSNGQSLVEMLGEEGMPIRHFSFPPERSQEQMNAEIARLERHFGVSREETLKQKRRLDEIRAKLVCLDEWTWREGIVSGKENHFWLVNSSDFNGDPDRFEEELDAFMREAALRDPLKLKLRVAYLGVPPIYQNLYDTISDLGSGVVFNEVQRQFSMPHLLPDIVDQYIAYTYSYSVFARLKDIIPELKKRKIDVVISYTQSFCHLQIDNILLKKYIDLPFLTLEGDQPEEIDNRTLLRLESFFEVHG
ncbi:MAG: 2-hydroxyacyl-CoA dehydratase family protein [Candidatus Cloacimonadaceae bacterium]|nr:2-hydroxyacyl-CoA dehydratase family protein [Candidatus Cloacimonadaceae bacterium]MDP3113558.1 2-hydroxyacyl-CoA dehydratase family protein [Candidatus Cloacimonadaceae bacterium]